MSTAAERQQARLRGSMKATQRSMRLDLDPAEPVDIFGVIEREPVWLLFEPLKDLYGFFDRHGNAAGIVIQSKHPLSLQRFTAAHEYGHYVLEHTRSHDTRYELFASGSNLDLQEIEAQAFAAEFLMPLALVNRALDRLEMPRKPHGMSPVSAYQLSLEIGSSYTATVTQLCQLNMISDSDAKRLRQSEVIDIKVTLGDGMRPANARSDVWLINEQLRQRRMQLRPGDELHVRLPEIPSSGYRWWLEAHGTDGLELVQDELEAAELTAGRRVGAERRRHLWWRATSPGTSKLELRLRRRRQGSQGQVADALEIVAPIHEPLFDAQLGRGISAPQRAAYVRRLAA